MTNDLSYREADRFEFQFLRRANLVNQATIAGFKQRIQDLETSLQQQKELHILELQNQQSASAVAVRVVEQRSRAALAGVTLQLAEKTAELAVIEQLTKLLKDPKE